MQITNIYMRQFQKLQIEAYGKTKDRLETNGSIERGNPSTIHETRRSPRSIETETTKQDGVKEGDLEDLEGQDAKVFRPLFVYRQQMARKQHRAKNQIYGFPKIPCEKRAPIFWSSRFSALIVRFVFSTTSDDAWKRGIEKAFATHTQVLEVD